MLSGTRASRDAEGKQAEIFAAAGPFEIQQKFKLEPIVYEGKLEL